MHAGGGVASRQPGMEAMSRPVSPGGVFRQPQTWVLLTALVYALAQLLLVDLERFFEWDEAVYVAEVNRSIPTTGFAAHRAGGITLLVAPVTLLTDSVTMLRVYLIARCRRWRWPERS